MIDSLGEEPANTAEMLVAVIRVALASLVLCICVSAQTEKQALYALLLDNTGSMTTQFRQVVLTGQGIVKRASPRGQVLLANFKTDNPFAVATVGIGWTQDDSTLNSYLDQLRVVPGHTVLFEAIEAAADELDLKAGPSPGGSPEKFLILITDGHEIVRRHTGMLTGPVWEDEERNRIRKQVIKRLKSKGIKVYAVGLTRELEGTSIMGMSHREKAENFLKKMAKETGGRAVFPKSKTFDVDKLLDELLAQ